MTFSDFGLAHPKDEAAAAFVSQVGRALQHALVERKALGKLTQREISDRLGIDRSRVNRCFSGYANLSLETLAELCWAMDVEPSIALTQILADRTANIAVPERISQRDTPLSSAARTAWTSAERKEATITAFTNQSRVVLRYAS